MTLPVWRDKIAAGIAGAQFRKQAAQARWSAEEISLGVEFAETTFMIREADRQLQSIRERLLPPARQMLEVARAAYRSGQTDFLNVIEAQRTLLGLELEQIARQTQREVSLAQLALMVAGRPPAQAPLQKDAVPAPQSTR
jgi:outer membrane protein TolC